ncbi:hypothetical protein C8R44DRAFT_27582 [Mycena epipterygia]|nr:hypothetical protein C8R44DRAFT_27582 [Mycena epipterygia]
MDKGHAKHRTRSSAERVDVGAHGTTPKVYYIGKNPNNFRHPLAKRVDVGADGDAESTSSTPPTGTTPKVYYIGQNPNHFRRSSGRGKPVSKAPTTSLSQSNDDSGTDSDTNTNPATVGSQLEGSSQISNYVHESPEPSINNENDWPTWCVFCGTPPVVPQVYTRELRQLFPGDVLGILATIGILHDLHLRILAFLNESQRQNFLLSFVPSKFSQFKVLEISEEIATYARAHAGDEFPAGYIDACLRHQDQNSVDVPSELNGALRTFGMEELGPAAVFLGIDSNARFQQMRRFKPEAKKAMVFENMKELKLSPFQNLMLELALTAAS